MFDEIAEKFVCNPFVSSFCGSTDFYQEVPKFGENVERLKQNENFSKSKILYSMIEYARIYEQFRPKPKKITMNDDYYGTVEKMDAIYFDLFKYLDADLLLTFSRSAFTDIFDKFDNAPKKMHSEMEWDTKIDYIREIDKAILITMENHAVNLYCLLREHVPQYIDHLVTGFILRSAKTLRKEDINLNKGSVFIKGKELSFKNRHQLFDALLEFDNPALN